MRALAVVITAALGCSAPSGHPRLVAVADERYAADPFNRADTDALRFRANVVMHELIAALPEDTRARLDVTLVADAMGGAVNAYATCASQTEPIVAISDALLHIEAQLAIARASDDLFGTEKRRAYIRWIAERGKQPVTAPPEAFWDSQAHLDPRKLSLQRAYFDEQIAYVIAHELAHHYLGHLACAGDGSILQEIGRVASNEVPLFSQAAEIAADVKGIKNVLAAGKRRRDYAWTEEGALVFFEFLTKWRELTASDIVLAFERTHPWPIVRLPIITSTAELWHSSGGHLPL